MTSSLEGSGLLCRFAREGGGTAKKPSGDLDVGCRPETVVVVTWKIEMAMVMVVVTWRIEMEHGGGGGSW